MDSDKIRSWRPTKFSEIIGGANQRCLSRLQRSLIKGRLPSPLLLVGVFGYGKTSVARLLLKSLCCKARDPVSADPCNSCHWCQCFGLHYHGYGEPFRRFEYDCTTLTRSELIQILGEHRFETDEAIFLDELHWLNEKLGQEPLLKFVEDFKGLFLAAIMEDRLREIIPPLRERLEFVRMTPPSEEEMAEFFTGQNDPWNVRAAPDVIEFMVKASNNSFRFGLKAYAAATDEPDRTLTKELVQQFL